MNWDAIGALSELVAASIVAISLVFVVRQFRQQSAASEQNSFHASYLGMAQHLNHMFGEANAPLIAKGFRSWMELSPVEKLRFDYLMANLLNFAEAGYRASQADMLHDSLETWRWVLRHCIFAYPGARDWWAQSGEFYPDDVRGWLQDQVSGANQGADRYGLLT